MIRYLNLRIMIPHEPFSLKEQCSRNILSYVAHTMQPTMQINSHNASIDFTIIFNINIWWITPYNFNRAEQTLLWLPRLPASRFDFSSDFLSKWNWHIIQPLTVHLPPSSCVSKLRAISPWQNTSLNKHISTVIEGDCYISYISLDKRNFLQKLS